MNDNCVAKIAAKVESFNPAGSIKDRPALNMIEDAERKGIIIRIIVIVTVRCGTVTNDQRYSFKGDGEDYGNLKGCDR